MKQQLKLILVGIAAIAIVGAGAIGANAFAESVHLVAPAGLRSADGVPTTPAPDPTYAINASGQTYGSDLQANSPANQPDLILVVATNGKEGYVLRSDLDAADGTTASESFKSPADALAWQAAHENAPATAVTVYASDGTTPIGVFDVGPSVAGQ